MSTVGNGSREACVLVFMKELGRLMVLALHNEATCSLFHYLLWILHPLFAANL